MKKPLFTLLLLTCSCSPAFSEDKAPVPLHVIENTKYLVGEWTAEVEMDGKIRELKMKVAPMPGNVGYTIRWQGPGGPGKEDTQMTGIGGWDASSERYQETAFGSNGDYLSFRYKLIDPSLPSSAQRFEAEGSGVYMGQPMTEKVSVERKGRNQFTWKATDMKVGGKPQPDQVYKFVRTKDAIGEWLDFLVGEWTRESKVWTEGDDPTTTTADWSCKAVSGGNTLLFEGKESNGVTWVGMGSRYGQEMIEQGSASDGAVWKINWEKVAKMQVHGTLTGYMPDGVQGKGKITIERKGDGYVTTWQLKLASGGGVAKGVETNMRRKRSGGK